MTYKIVVPESLCYCEIFVINGIKADEDDFGNGADDGYGENYCCEDRVFAPRLATQEILNKYNINLNEYNTIANELVGKLSFGACCMCS